MLAVWIPAAVSLAIRHESNALIARLNEKVEDVGQALSGNPPGPDADRPVMSGVSHATVGDVVTIEVSDPIIIERENGERLFVIAATVANTTPNRKLDDLVFRSALTDNWGNNYNSTFVWIKGRPEFNGDLLPGERSTDVLMLEPPMPGFEYLDLDLSVGPNPGLISFTFDAIETAHVRIPRAAIATMGDEAWIAHRGFGNTGAELASAIQIAEAPAPPPVVTPPYEIVFPECTLRVERCFLRVFGSETLLVVSHTIKNTTQHGILELYVVTSVRDNWGNDYPMNSGWWTDNERPHRTGRIRPGQLSAEWDLHEAPIEGFSSVELSVRVIGSKNLKMEYGKTKIVIDASQIIDERDPALTRAPAKEHPQ